MVTDFVVSLETPVGVVVGDHDLTEVVLSKDESLGDVTILGTEAAEVDPETVGLLLVVIDCVLSLEAPIDFAAVGNLVLAMVEPCEDEDFADVPEPFSEAANVDSENTVVLRDDCSSVVVFGYRISSHLR